MTRPVTHIPVLVLAVLSSGCSPPELTAPQEELVGRCLELARIQETSDECSQVTKPMEKAYLEKHPDFYDRLLADRKAFVEERMAEAQRRADELDKCIDARERGNTRSPDCKNFTLRDINRAARDRHLRSCAEAKLDDSPDAPKRCRGLSDRDIEEEVQAERVRRDARD